MEAEASSFNDAVRLLNGLINQEKLKNSKLKKKLEISKKTLAVEQHEIYKLESEIGASTTASSETLVQNVPKLDFTSDILKSQLEKGLEKIEDRNKCTIEKKKMFDEKVLAFQKIHDDNKIMNYEDFLTELELKKDTLKKTELKIEELRNASDKKKKLFNDRSKELMQMIDCLQIILSDLKDSKQKLIQLQMYEEEKETADLRNQIQLAQNKLDDLKNSLKKTKI